VVSTPFFTPALPNAKQRFALVGSAPDKWDEHFCRPFSGFVGREMWEDLATVGIYPGDCFQGYVYPGVPPQGKVKLVKRSDLVLSAGSAKLLVALTEYKPTHIICLGSHAATVLTGAWRDAYTWRGTFLPSVLPGGPKVLVLNDPYTFQDDGGQRFFWKWGVEKIKRWDEVPLERKIEICTDRSRAERVLQDLHGKRMGFDIEGWVHTGVTSMAFAPSATEAYVIPFVRGDKSRVFTTSEEASIWDEFRELVASCNTHGSAKVVSESLVAGHPPEINVGASKAGLVLHNALYDAYVLSKTHHIPIHDSIADDTMLLWWEMFSEADKALADLSSCLTMEPFWKQERGSQDDEVVWRYNGKDACVTMECCDAMYQRPELTPGAYRHYQFNMSLLPPVLYMQLRGFRFDDGARRALHARAQRYVWRLQHVLNKWAGLPTISSSDDLMAAVRKLCAKRPASRVTVNQPYKAGPKKGQDRAVVLSTPVEIKTLAQAEEYALAPHRDALAELHKLLGNGKLEDVKLTPTLSGRISVLLNTHLNIGSPAANDFLYGKLGLPAQYKREAGRQTDKLTHDGDAMLQLYLLTQKQSEKYGRHEPLLRLWMRLASLTTSLETLGAGPDTDGRFRASYNLVGTKTGRFSCSKSAGGQGYNLQTVTKGQRFMFLADDGCTMGQHDLSGADGWTIAANCARFEDRTMLDDYAAKLKPAKLVALVMEHGVQVNEWSRDRIREEVAKLPDDWRGHATKVIIWGTCYLMGLRTMQMGVLANSYHPGRPLMFLTTAQCGEVQNAVFTRYPGIQKWQAWVGDYVAKHGELEHPNGHIRRFFGNRFEWVPDGVGGAKRPEIRRQVHGDALSEAPQQVTTFATKMALWRLWYDPDNREPAWKLPKELTGFPALRVEPLHTVHDSLVTQWVDSAREFARRKLGEWFQNTINIHGEAVVIPAAGECSKDWGMKNSERV
jgi:hypothetical protein